MRIDVDVRYLPGQDADEIRRAIDDLPDVRVVKVFHRRPAMVDRDNPFVQTLGEAIARVAPPDGDQISVGRDGASDAISFLEAGVPAVECGPVGAGHHGPEEWVSVRSLGRLSAGAGRVRQPAPGPAGPGRAPTSNRLMLEDIPRPGIWKRLLLGGVPDRLRGGRRRPSVAAFHEVDKIVDKLKLGPELKLARAQLATTDPGKPQTLMILGSDRRPKNNVEGASGGARSDTIMLVRLDPGKKATAIMSLPRDLKVEIPGHGTDKINAAYELGGPQLTLETVKQVTGLSINHVINVHFDGFWRAVNAVGCVYVDVDRRYYNDSAEYSYINVQPGYQRLCGTKALQYVRFRHEDTDIVRAARQQDFLRQAKQQITAVDAVRQQGPADDDLRAQHQHRRRRCARARRCCACSSWRCSRPTQPDPGGQLPRVARAELRGDHAPPQMREMTHEFLNVEDTPGPARRGDQEGQAPQAQAQAAAWSAASRTPPAFGKDQALQAVQAGAGMTLPALYPTLGACRARVYAGPPRVYKMRGTDGKRYGALPDGLQTGHVGEYYGLQGTTWKNPPILEGVTETRKIGGRTYELAYDGDRLRLVAWRTQKAVYWISNTLLLSLDEKQMLAIARIACRAL